MIELRPIGSVESPLTDLAAAPKQGDEGAPEARLVLERAVLDALDGITPGDRIIVLTWLDRARRDVLRVHPRGDPANPIQGVFATRSPDRPNPIGLHEVEVLAIDGASIRVRPIEAVHGTPIVDIKPVLDISRRDRMAHTEETPAGAALPPAPDNATPQERKRNPFTKSAAGGRVLSALMLPLFAVRPPSGFGVLTTTGRRTGKTRRKCIRVIRRGTRAYIVMLGPALLGRTGPGTTSAWLWNIRANPRVSLRLRGGTFTGVARELEDGPQKEQAREAYCETVHAFDYLECDFHLGGRATRAKIKQLHRHWFDTGIPLVVDLADQQRRRP